ncbi:hypothetical protein ACFVYJ_00200 [Pontibacter sp. JAM-7]|uniref:hypothetical protein n=1 Tax=Pontibacter sp. JAM-7 TaxID=3366581 RepID=UPI003AF48583
MLSCPHCHCHIILRDLPHQGFWRSDRRCPNCGEHFRVDAKTRHLQAWFIGVALVSLLLTVLLYFRGGTDCLLVTLISYLLLAGLIGWGNRKVYLVPLKKE